MGSRQVGVELANRAGGEECGLDLGTEKARRVSITVPGDRAKIRTQAFDASDLIFNRNVSSTAKRAVVEARGDIWTLPAKKGSPINLTRTSGAAERDPSWSPNGKWIAYFSDETGEYELYVTQSDGRGDTRRLTSAKRGYLYSPVWSPDSKWICYWDKTGTLHLTEAENGKTRTVDHFKGWGRQVRVSWSHDSNWMAYSLPEGMTRPRAIWLYNVETNEKHQVTSGMFNDTWPAFDREGKYLYFASQRDFSSPMYEDLGTTWIYAKTDRLYAVPLTEDIASPVPPKSDDEEWDKEDGDESSDEDKKDKETKNDEKGDKKDEGDEGDEEKPEPVLIDIEGFEGRVVALPVKRGNFGLLNVNEKGKLIYSRSPIRGEDGEAVIHLLDLDEDKEDKKDQSKDQKEE